MITFFTGLPRSGKSYRAVWYIQKNFIDSKSSNYLKHHFLYTNIGGFKHDQVNLLLDKNPIEHDEIIDDNLLQTQIIKESFSLDWKVVYSHFKKMHEMFLAEKSDFEILRYAKYHKLTPALFVYDEAYKYYTKKSDPVLVFINAYHGHLGMDIIFIIHSPKLMHADYKVHTEEFIDAQPKSKSLSDKSFRYKFYATDQYKTDPSYHSDKLPVDQKIFDLYKSGDMHSPKKILHKFIGFIIGGIAFVVAMFYYLFSSLSTDPEKSENNMSVAPSISSASSISSAVSSSMLLRVRCDDVSCSRVDNAYVINYIPKLYFEESLKTIDYKLIASSTVKIFNVEYSDHLYSIPSDSIAYFSMWNIPVTKKNSSKSNFSSAGDVYKNAGV